MEPAKDFLDTLDDKSREKILFNIWKSRETSDPELFKKLTGEIWEFRTRFNSKQFRLLAFWDKTRGKETLVIATHDENIANESDRIIHIKDGEILN